MENTICYNIIISQNQNIYNQKIKNEDSKCIFCVI